MKRCPKCNRTFTTDTQKFCTHDGGILEGVADIKQPDTIRIDAAESAGDETTKEISAETLKEAAPDFDPFKTVMSGPHIDPFKTMITHQETVADHLRDTQGLPATTSPSNEPSAPPPDSEQVPPPPKISAPLPPPQSSPSAPTMALTGTAPIAAAPAPPPPPPPPVQPVPTQQAPITAPPAKKKSKLPLVLGILVVLLLFGGAALGAVYWFVARPMLAARKVVVVDTPPPTEAPTPNIEAPPTDVPKTVKTEAPEPPPYSAPSNSVQFVNSKDNLSGQLAEHYVDFSFYYPDYWQKDPTAGVPGARNFAQVERRLPPDFTQENFAVAWNSSAAPVSENIPVFHTLAQNLGAQFAKKFPGYRKVSEGETKVGVYDAYEFRFEGESKGTVKGDLKLWGRVIFLPPQDGGKDGVTLLMLATSLASELKSVNDVGVRGDLPMMLESFRFGKK